ncbi:MAG: hypothetical protein AAB511_02570 [Patescibacteria group bacterium]
MLAEDQIDYLFQIRDSKPAIPADTVRVMLKALRWNPEEIDHGIDFLNRPDAPVSVEKALTQVSEANISNIEPEISRPIKIKQNPFPVGSPFATGLKQQEAKRHKRLMIVGGVAGFLVFVVGLFAYAYLSVI